MKIFCYLKDMLVAGFIFIFVLGALFGAHIAICHERRYEQPTVEQFLQQGAVYHYSRFQIILGIAIPLIATIIGIILLILNR